MYGFVNDARRGLISATPNELKELGDTEQTDNQTVETSTKELERYERIRTSLRRTWLPPDAGERQALRTSVDNIEWLTAYANSVLDANKL